MPQLSWDLHLHPAPSTAPRWGDGLQVWQAASEAGARVWMSRIGHLTFLARAERACLVQYIFSAPPRPRCPGGFRDLSVRRDAALKMLSI